MSALSVRCVGAGASPETVYAALRAPGGSFWADHGRAWIVMGGLRDVGPTTADSWRAEARGALAGARPPASDLPFHGGRVGWFSYEAGAWMDRMPAPPSAPPLPLAWLGSAPAAACLDRRSGHWWVAGERAAADGIADTIADAIRAARDPAGPPAPSRGEPRGVRVPRDDRAAYEAGVERILGHLRAGDCYQVNLARRVEVGRVGDPLEVWLRLRASNPARRALLVETRHGAVVSNSPELMLSVRGDRLLSVPIKGTAPRRGGTGTPPEVAALLASPKERAELTMIVDLVRADLGRVAAAGTVRAGPRRVGAVGHVWHAMRRVWARLEPGLDAVDAFAAVFPAGSVTGAPKLRAMEVIRELEPHPRGAYCGAIGWFGAGGDAWWNVAIRTITIVNGDAEFHVGAGIVIGSDPAREFAETELKAERMLGALA